VRASRPESLVTTAGLPRMIEHAVRKDPSAKQRTRESCVRMVQPGPRGSGPSHESHAAHGLAAVLSSRMRDRAPSIARERVKGPAGTSTYPPELSVLPGGRHAIGRRLYFHGGIMLNPLYRAERCRDLAQECRAIAALCAPSSEMRNRYSRMSEHYSALAEAEELGIPASGH
jgi:hypothetical protein